MKTAGGRRIAFLVLGLLPWTVGGCGFLFSHGPPTGYERMDHFSCTENNTAPVVDLVLGGLYLIDVAVFAGDSATRATYKNPDTGAAFSFALAVLSGVAAGVGFDKSKRCRAAKLEWAKRRAGVQAVVVTPGTDTLRVGEDAQLVANAFASSGAVVPDKVFTWSSSNDPVASVSKAGRVTAHAAGTAVISAYADDVVGTASIIVVSSR
jgi:Big-like domain-containing protein